MIHSDNNAVCGTIHDAAAITKKGRMHLKIKVRKEKKDDHSGIYAVNELAFENENESKLVDLLRKRENFVRELSIVADLDGKIIGHILFTKVEIIDRAGTAFESLCLAPMAVLPSFQNMGIGTVLVKSGLDKATKLGYQSVIVLGHAAYYPRFGFLPAEKWNITCPYEVPSEVFMALELVPGSLRAVSGQVRYPKEFDDV